MRARMMNAKPQRNMNICQNNGKKAAMYRINGGIWHSHLENLSLDKIQKPLDDNTGQKLETITELLELNFIVFLN